MPPATKRRKLSPGTSHPVAAPAAQPSIQAYGKISKSQVQDPRKGASSKNGTAKYGKDINGSGISKKRKLGPRCSSGVVNKEGEEASSLGKHAPSVDDSSCRDGERSIDTLDTPTKGARSCIESIALLSSSPSSPSSSSGTAQRETPPSSPASAESEPCQQHELEQLPEEVQDLVDLHSAFLTALSLHYAHNGSTTPVDLRSLGPGIERAWRKRRVTPQDVRRILAIGRPERVEGHQGPGPFHVSDYGHGKICVEIADRWASRTITRRPINEEDLNAMFLRNLEHRWMHFKNANQADPSPSNFIASLALSPITPCTSLSKLAPLFSKGQRRLEDLKAAPIKPHQRPLSVKSANTTPLPPPSQPKPTSARSTDLFSRLKAKQLHQSTLPLPPSAETLARKSALHRVHEIVPVLKSLAISSKKRANDDDAVAAAAMDVKSTASSPVSFTMPTLVQHLQMSLRNPIGKDEVVRSVRVLAEVAPEWVSLKEMGRMLSVTVRGAGVRRDVLERGIEGLLEKL